MWNGKPYGSIDMKRSLRAKLQFILSAYFYFLSVARNPGLIRTFLHSNKRDDFCNFVK